MSTRQQQRIVFFGPQFGPWHGRIKFVRFAHLSVKGFRFILRTKGPKDHPSQEQRVSDGFHAPFFRREHNLVAIVGQQAPRDRHLSDIEIGIWKRY
jgi:hypothetical protein